MLAFIAPNGGDSMGTQLATVTDETAGGGGGGDYLPRVVPHTPAVQTPAFAPDVTAATPVAPRINLGNIRPTDVNPGGAPLVAWTADPVTAAAPQHDTTTTPVVPDVPTVPVSIAPPDAPVSTNAGGLVPAADPSTSAGSLDLSLADRAIDLFGKAFGQAPSTTSTAGAAPIIVQPTQTAAPAATSTGPAWGRLAVLAILVAVVVFAVRYYRAHHGHGHAAHTGGHAHV